MTEQRHESLDQEAQRTASSSHAVDASPGAAERGAREQAHWLHPSSLVFEFVAGIRSHLIPAVLALFGASTGTWLGGLIALLYFVGSMIAVVLRYAALRYRLASDELIIDEGFVFHVHRTVPIQRIQNIDMVQNPFHRLLRVAEVRVETASGTEPEAVLRVLSLAEFESLRARIFARKRSYELARTEASVPGSPPPIVPEQPTTAAQPVAEAPPQRDTILKISFAQLALAGIASNRGTALLFVGLGFVSQQFSNVARSWRIDTAALTRFLPENTSAIVLLALAIAGLLALLISVKMLSIAWYVLKFYDYRLDRSGDDLRVHCGLLTRVSATVRRDRIQLISIRRTLIGRWLKIASIRIETAGGDGESDDPATTIARRWFLPVIFEAQIPAIMEQLSPGLKWDERAFDWQRLSSQAAWRMRRMIVLALGLLAIIAGLFGLAAVVVALVLFGALAWWWSGRWVAAMRYARPNGKIIFRSGVFTEKCSIAFIDKIQSVTIDLSPLDRRWNMATLSVDTVASGPAEHRIAIPMLDAACARNERDIICRAASLAR